MAEFDAPKIPVKLRKQGEFEWATYIKARTPQFKIHRTVGHAHAAITARTYLYQRRSPTVINSDLALYHQEDGEWVPKLELAYGSRISHFPWQPVPPTPEEHQREQKLSRMTSSLSSLIDTAQRELSGETQAKVVSELRATKTKVLRLIQES